MLTKEEFCKAYIKQYEMENKIESVSGADVFKSTNLGICMDYLGLTNSEESEYLSNRGGILFEYVDEEKLRNGDDTGFKTLSMRELIRLLPEKE